MKRSLGNKWKCEMNGAQRSVTVCKRLPGPPADATPRRSESALDGARRAGHHFAGLAAARIRHRRLRREMKLHIAEIVLLEVAAERALNGLPRRSSLAGSTRKACAR